MKNAFASKKTHPRVKTMHPEKLACDNNASKNASMGENSENQRVKIMHLLAKTNKNTLLHDFHQSFTPSSYTFPRASSGSRFRENSARSVCRCSSGLGLTHLIFVCSGLSGRCWGGADLYEALSLSTVDPNRSLFCVGLYSGCKTMAPVGGHHFAVIWAHILSRLAELG